MPLNAPVNNACLCCLCVPALVLAGCFGGPRVKARATEVLQPTIAFRNPLPKEFEVQFHCGLLVLEPGDALSCGLKIDVTAPTLDDLATLRAQIRPTIDEAADGSKTSISVELPTGAPLECLQTIYQLKVPPQVFVRVTTRDGAVSARGFRGNLEVRSTSGNVDVCLAGGSARLASEGGNLELRGSYRTAELRTRSGRVNLELPPPGLALDLNVATRDGDVFVDMHQSQNLDVRFRGEVEQVRADPEVRVLWEEDQEIGGVDYHVGSFGDPNAPLDGRMQLATEANVHLRLSPMASPGTY